MAGLVAENKKSSRRLKLRFNNIFLSYHSHHHDHHRRRRHRVHHVITIILSQSSSHSHSLFNKKTSLQTAENKVKASQVDQFD